MVKIAIAGASSQLAQEVLDKLVATQKHDIVALVRKDPSQFSPLAGVQWVQVNYEDKTELVQLLNGVHTVLCFFATHLDPGSEVQKRLIDASVEAGAKRYAPSEWSSGVALASALDVTPWYAGKVEVASYLESLNKEKKVLEYSRFQPGGFMNYLGHPHRVSKHVTTLPLQVDIEKQHAILVEGSLDDQVTYTTVADIGNVVARAVDYEGEWPAVGGIRGSRVTIRELVQIGERVRGKPFTIEWLKKEDLEAGELKTDNYHRLNMPSIPKDQIESFSKVAVIGLLLGISRSVWTVSDEWNQILPDYEFTQVADFLKGLWEGQQ